MVDYGDEGYYGDCEEEDYEDCGVDVGGCEHFWLLVVLEEYAEWKGEYYDEYVERWAVVLFGFFIGFVN